MITSVRGGDNAVYEAIKKMRLEYAQTQKGKKTTPSKSKPKLSLDAGRMF